MKKELILEEKKTVFNAVFGSIPRLPYLLYEPLGTLENPKASGSYLIFDSNYLTCGFYSKRSFECTNHSVSDWERRMSYTKVLQYIFLNKIWFGECN